MHRYFLFVGMLATYAARAQATQPDTASSIVHGQIGARLDSVLRAAEAVGFTGVVLVSRGPYLVLKGGYGLADPVRNIRANGSSVVAIHSVTKAFTAAAVLQLFERGALKLTDSLPKVFADVPSDKRAIVKELAGS